MSLRKTQLKKMTLSQIMILLSTEIDPENIKLITNFIQQKNETLINKRTMLLNQLQNVRKGIEKNIKNMNGRVKDRIDKKETIVMDKDSRPTTETMSELMELFSFMEAQISIIDRNNLDVKQIATLTEKKKIKIQQISKIRAEFSALDQKYIELNKAGNEEQVVRNTILKDRNDRRVHYSSIQSSIDSYRKQYEIVQAKIRQKQRQLLQISGYYEARVNQEQFELANLPKLSVAFQQQLLNAQSRLNDCQKIYNQRLILQTELYHNV